MLRLSECSIPMRTWLRIIASARSALSSKISQSSSVFGSMVMREACGTLGAALTWTVAWFGKEMHSAKRGESCTSYFGRFM